MDRPKVARSRDLAIAFSEKKEFYKETETV